jgi:hypothetical protein
MTGVSPAPAPRLVRLLLVLLVAYFALASFPGTPRPRGSSLDESWVLGLNMARAQGLVAGAGFVSTYGPLGYLRFPDPVTGSLAPAVVYRFGVWLLWIAALARLAFTLRPRLAAVWLVLVFGAIALADVSRPDLLELAIAGLCLLAFTDAELRWPELALLAVLSGLAAMVKANVGAEAFLLLLAAGVTTSLKRLPMLLAVFAASLAGFYFLSTGHLLTLAAYVKYGWEISSGFAASMGAAGPLWQFLIALAAIAALLAGIPALSAAPRALARGLAPAAIVAFFGFKLAMVRQDAHVLGFATDLALASLFLFVCAATRRDRRMVGLFQVAALALSLFITSAWPPLFGRVGQRFRLASAKTAIAAWAGWPATFQKIRTADQRERDSLRLGPEYHAAIDDGTVDAVPFDIASVRANGWRWRPRPMLQSYAAYTPALDRLDAEHILGPRAADFLLLDWTAIDGRHPFLEEPLAWRSILARYRLVLDGRGPLLLARAVASPPATLRPLGAVSARWDEPLRLPRHDGILVARVAVVRSLYGSVRNLLYRTDPVFLDVTYSSGETRRWRTVWPNLASGFIAGALPRSRDEFTAFLQSRGHASDPAVSIAFDTPGPVQFRGAISIAWFDLSFLPPQPFAP